MNAQGNYSLESWTTWLLQVLLTHCYYNVIIQVHGLKQARFSLKIILHVPPTQYKKNFCSDLIFVILQLKGIVVLNASMNVCY